jgi:hypothetical protein
MARFFTTTLGDGRLSRDFEREPQGGSAQRAMGLPLMMKFLKTFRLNAAREPSYWSVGTCLRKFALVCFSMSRHFLIHARAGDGNLAK